MNSFEKYLEGTAKIKLINIGYFYLSPGIFISQSKNTCHR